MHDKKPFNILIVGVGGQGVVSLSRIIAAAAQESHPFVCRTESRGLSQRGGAVSSAVRLSSTPIVPTVDVEESHLVIALDALEGARAKPSLAASGRLISERGFTFPLYWLRANTVAAQHALSMRIAEALTDDRVTVVDAADQAVALGSSRVASSFLLGVASWYLPVDCEALAMALAEATTDKSCLLNALAFKTGREVISNCVARFTQQAS